MATDPFSESFNLYTYGKQSRSKTLDLSSGPKNTSGSIWDASFGTDEVKPEDSLAGLRSLASEQGYSLKKERSGLETLSRTLNYFPARFSGVIAGITKPTDFGKQYNRYTDGNLGFTDLYKELFGAPITFGGKAALTTVGFASDVLFDPITYMSFGIGAGAKLGKAVTLGTKKIVEEVGVDGITRMVTKTIPEKFYMTSQGRKLYSDAISQKFSTETALVSEGFGKKKAERLALSLAKRDVQELFEGAVSKSGGKLDDAAVDRFVAKGFERATVEEISQLGPKLLDAGGIKWFGKTLVTSKVLAETPIGKAAKAILESDGVSALTKRVKDTIGETFVWAYGKNPVIANLVLKAGIFAGMDAETYISKSAKSIDKILEKIPPQNREKLFKAVYDRRQEVVKMTKTTENKMMEQISMTGATGQHIASELAKGEHPLVLRNVLESLQGGVIRKLALKLENIAKSHAEMSWEGDGLQQILEIKKKELATARELLQEEFDQFAKDLNSTRKVAEREISEEEYSATVKYLDSLKKQITQESIVNTQGKIDELLAAIDKGVIPEGMAKAGAKIASPDAGKQTIYYHGTGEEFDNFSLEKTGGGGFYFTRQKADAESFAEGRFTGKKVVKEVYLDIKNPAPKEAIIEAFNKANTGNPSKEVREYLIKQGYDGYYGEKSIVGANRFAETVVFYPEQIKAVPKVYKQEPLNFVEKAAILRKQLLDETNKFKALDDSLTNFSNARRVAKAELKKSRIEFLPKLSIAAEKFRKLSPEEQELRDLDDAASKLFYDEDAVTKQMARDAGIEEDDMYAEYIRNAYDNGTQVRTFANGTIGALGGKGLNKAIKEINYEDAVKRGLIKDPLPIIKQTANQIAILKAKKSTINALTKSVGRSLDTFADEKIAKSHGFEKFTRIDPVTGQTVGGYFPKELMPDIEGYWTPKKSALTEFTEKFGLQWGTKLFKSAATSIWPAFHILNIGSNELQNMISLGTDAFNPRYQKISTLMAGLSSTNPKVRAAAQRVLAGEMLTSKDGQKISALKLFKKIHGSSPELFTTGPTSKIEMGASATPDFIGKLAQGKYNPLNPENIAFAKGQAFGSLVESRSKLMHVIAAFEAGGDISQGVKSAEAAIFNYGKLSVFEKEVMKQVIPFYSFARKNLEFQINMLTHNPGRVSMQLKIFNAMNASLSNLHEQDEETGLPLYMRDSLGIHLGNVGTGEHAYIKGIGLPIEDFARRLSGDRGFFWNAMKSVAMQANPLLKYPIEEITGVDIFKGRPIKELTDAQGYADMFKNMPTVPRKQLEALMNFREIPNQPVYKNGIIVGYETKYYANPYAMHFMNNMPYSRFVRSAQQLAGQERQVVPILQLVTGANVTMVDMEKQRYFKGLEEYNELGDWLDKIGVMGKYTKYYIPKTEEEKLMESFK